MNFMSTKIFKKIPSLDLPEVKGSHRKFRTVVASLIALKHSPSKKTKALKVKGGQASGQSSASGTSPPEKISQLGTEGPFPSATPRPDVVPDSWSGPTDTSLPDVRLEPRPLDSSLSRSTLDTPSKLSMRGTPTPTWTEGTPSYTDSTYSGDALPDTPARSLDIEDFGGAGGVVDVDVGGEGNARVEKLDLRDDKEPYHETEMTRL
jgi:1-phosphatidylinositol-4-phosphate 5-kinase